MRTSALAACLFLAASLTWETDAARAKKTSLSGPVLLLPGGKEPCRLRLDVVVDGKSPELAWEAFLDRLFDHFDSDGDGSLSRTEAARIMPLPLPGGRELTIDFDRLDTDKDGKGSRDELKVYCRGNGFTPVVVVVAPPSAADLRLAELFFRCLDINSDGKLTREGLRRAPQLLRKYDHNDDEYLELAELLAGTEGGRRPVVTQLKAGSRADEKDMVLRLELGVKARAVLEKKRDDAGRLVPAKAHGGLYRLHGAANWSLTFRAVWSTADVRSAGEFLIAQFKAALGDGAALTKADLQEDAALAGFLELLPYADRNGDSRLSLAELKAYLELVELGMRAQVWVTATDHDRNPFHFLDSDGDGRLSYREQVSAPDLLGGKTAMRGLPSQFDLSFGGPPVKSWGGVAVPAVKRPRPTLPDLRAAPAWFRAMDRNGDGVLSPREFIGPPELFRKLDLDGDGVISPAEAARAMGR
jgi:Ca2+-binding EF-hand superfamily protein